MPKTPDVLMVAAPRSYRKQKFGFKTLFLTAEQFYQNEALVQRHDEVLWQSFHTHGRYGRIARQVEYVVVAIEKSTQYVSSALIVPVGAKWLVEYVMTDPLYQGRGAASAVMDQVMREAKKHHIQWVILNCNPKKNQGQLLKFYAKFGFIALPSEAPNSLRQNG